MPPTAQAAHQQASHLARMLPRRLAGKPLKPWRYRDFGSLVSLGEYSTVGTLMGALLGGSLFVEGLFARFMYVLLYRMHLYALHGFAQVLLDTLARLITRRHGAAGETALTCSFISKVTGVKGQASRMTPDGIASTHDASRLYP